MQSARPLLRPCTLFVFAAAVFASSMVVSSQHRGYEARGVDVDATVNQDQLYEVFKNELQDDVPYVTFLPYDAHKDNTYDQFIESAVYNDHIIIIPHDEPMECSTKLQKFEKSSGESKFSSRWFTNLAKEFTLRLIRLP